MDYLILRRRTGKKPARVTSNRLIDGGLDLDFHGFTRLFLNRSLLNKMNLIYANVSTRSTRELLPLA